MTIQELMENKKVTLIHNKNSFKGFNVKLERHEDGRVHKFIHVSPMGLPREETNNERSTLARSTCNDWEMVGEVKKEVVNKQYTTPVVIPPTAPPKDFVNVTPVVGSIVAPLQSIGASSQATIVVTTSTPTPAK